MTNDTYKNALIGMVGKFRPLDPANSSRADEVDSSALFRRDIMPPAEPCPHCGALLTRSPLLDSEGEFLAWNLYPDPCENPECVRLEEERVRREREREAEEKRRQAMADMEMGLEQSIGGSGFSEQDKEAHSFAAYVPTAADQRKALRICQNYADKFGERLGTEKGDGMGLYIHGGYGTGKTHLAIATGLVLREKLYNGIVYRSGSRMFSDIRATFSDPGATERDVIGVFSRCNLLILDDLEKGAPNEWAMARLFDILNERYRARRPVIIVSNHSREQLKDFLASRSNSDSAEAVYDRLVERTHEVLLLGESYRRRGA